MIIGTDVFNGRRSRGGPFLRPALESRLIYSQNTTPEE